MLRRTKSALVFLISEVLRPWLNGLDIMRERDGIWIIDFVSNETEQSAATNLLAI